MMKIQGFETFIIPTDRTLSTERPFQSQYFISTILSLVFTSLAFCHAYSLFASHRDWLPA